MKSFCLVVFLFISGYLGAQVTGIISSHTTGEKLASVSIQIKNTNQGVITDKDGNFSIHAGPGDILSITYIGYEPKEVTVTQSTSNIMIHMQESINTLDEVIVTGVFSKIIPIKSSIDITTIKNEQINQIVTNNATDLLQKVPGVFTSNSYGEVAAKVYTRGMVYGGDQQFVSFQEDGLPIDPFALFYQDGFLRNDITLQRLEAVVGGSASVLAVNSPGGMFNYISHTGITAPGLHMQSRFGLEGNLRNPYYRIDASLGGKFNDAWSYYIGGNYRYANGAQNPGYALNRGGQLKGNIQKITQRGKIQFYFKALNDNNALFQFIPTQGFDHPHPAGSFTASSSLQLPRIRYSFPSSVGGTGVDYDSRDHNSWEHYAIGGMVEQNLGNGFTLQNNLRVSSKHRLDNASIFVLPQEIGFPFLLFEGLLGRTGTYEFFNANTGLSYGTMTHNPDFTFTQKLNLPGGDIAPNSLLYSPAGQIDYKASDIMDQFILSKDISNHKFSLGGFFASSRFISAGYSPSGLAYTTFEDRPQAVRIEYTPDDATKNKVQLSDPNGIVGYGIGFNGFSHNKVILRQTSLFGGDQWNIAKKTTLDLGVRYEHFNISNSFIVTKSSVFDSNGGVDGDPDTWYDNYILKLSPQSTFDKTLSTVSFSGGINHQLNPVTAVYFRYSQGSKTPRPSDFIGTQVAFNDVKQEATRTVQLEGGLKFQKKIVQGALTPFYSLLPNVPNAGYGNYPLVGGISTTYPLKTIYNKMHAYGIELESNIHFTNTWNLRINGVIQSIYADKYVQWSLRNPGPEDDTLIDLSNKKLSIFATPLIFNLTPYYQSKKLYADLNFHYLGKRAANLLETFYLPAIGQLDLNASYIISPNTTIKVNINNVLNTYGTLQWSAPISGGIAFSAFDNDIFTKEKLKANPNAVYFTQSIQPRSLFFSLVLKL